MNSAAVIVDTYNKFDEKEGSKEVLSMRGWDYLSGPVDISSQVKSILYANTKSLQKKIVSLTTDIH